MKKLLLSTLFAALCGTASAEPNKEVSGQFIALSETYVIARFHTATEEDCEYAVAALLFRKELKSIVPKGMSVKIHNIVPYPNSEKGDYARGCVADYVFKPKK